MCVCEYMCVFVCATWHTIWHMTYYRALARRIGATSGDSKSSMAFVSFGNTLQHTATHYNTLHRTATHPGKKRGFWDSSIHA